MEYFDSEENAREYISIADGYDGRELIARLREFLDPGATVLEIGMGPGKDLLILAETYTATGSDLSDVFLRLFREENPHADLVRLDAVTLDIDRRFDCIYSNKVLHHLSTDELRSSLRRQREILNPGGMILHTFWKGSGSETIDNLRFVYYTEDDVRKMLEETHEIRVLATYSEMERDDSILLIARCK